MAQQTAQAPVSAYEKALMLGDVAGLTEQERLQYLRELAAEVGLSPITRPFGYLPTRGAMTVYLTATGAAQLRRIHNISVTEIVDEGIVNGFYRVKVYGRMPNGRVDVEYGSVPVTYTKTTDYHHAGDMFEPQELENCRKKVVTQAKTRLTKSMVGLSGVLAEEEIDDLAGEQGEPDQPRQIRAGQRQVDTATGEVSTAPAPAQLAAIHEARRLLELVAPGGRWSEMQTAEAAERHVLYLRKQLERPATERLYSLAIAEAQLVQNAGGLPVDVPDAGATVGGIASYVAGCRAAVEALTENPI